MRGRAAHREHGGPVRLYVAPMYGYKSLKWLDDDRAHLRPWSPATGRARGYDVDGWVGRSTRRDDTPGRLTRRRAPKPPAVPLRPGRAGAALAPRRLGVLMLAPSSADCTSTRVRSRRWSASATWCAWPSTSPRGCSCRPAARRALAGRWALVARRPAPPRPARRRRPALAATARTRADRPAREVQPGPEAQRRVSRLGAIVVMLGTGIILKWFSLFSLSTRTGGHVRARLGGVGHLDLRARAHLPGVARPRRAERHAGRWVSARWAGAP